MIRTGESTAAASEALTILGGKVRGGCADDLKGLLTGEWQEESKENYLLCGYGLATISRAASELAISGVMQQDKRGRLTFWRTPAQ